MPAEPANPPVACPAPAALGRHLEASLKQRWRSYRKKLKRCQQRFSETSVHDLRVETRRLLSEVDLLSVLITDDCLDRVCRELKRRLDSFDDLRDTQVQLAFMNGILRAFPELQVLQEELRRREKRLVKRLARKVNRSSVAKLARNMTALRKQVNGFFFRRRPQDNVYEALSGALSRAYANVVRLRGRIDASDTTTIHRTRLAFKKFRYMLESLYPVLPGVGRKQLGEMHDYQELMGDIQDVDVLSARVVKLVAKNKIASKSIRPLCRELARRQRALVKAYLRLADQLFTFWPNQS